MDPEQVTDNSTIPGDKLPEFLTRRGAIVLASLRPLLHHDLPNQLVALHGLLQMLRIEEQAHLSAEGREFLDRLLALSERLQQVLTGIRSLSKLLWESAVPERIPLSDLIREVAATTRQLFPARSLTYHLTVSLNEVWGIRRHLASLLVELVRLLAQAGETARVVHLLARHGDGSAELLIWGGLGPALGGAAQPPGVGFSEDAGDMDLELLGPDQRLSLLLVRELACACGGRLTARLEDRGAPVFRLLLPGGNAERGDRLSAPLAQFNREAC